jgi:hypothetical protein
MATLTKKQAEDIEYAKERIREMIKPGDTIYTVLRHCSKSGMTRHIDLYAIVDGENRYLSGYAATIMRDRIAKTGGIVVTGCGMDMGFSLVYNLGRYLYPDGFDLAENQYGRNGDKSKHDTDGGYAFKHSWL